MRRLLLSAWFSLSGILALPDPCPGQTVHGTVVDGTGRRAVEGAAVWIQGNPEVRTRTDASGHFRLPADGLNAVLHVTRPGYLPWSETVSISQTLIEVRLTPDPFQLEGIRVRSRAFGTIPSLQPRTVLGEGELTAGMAASVAATLVGEPGITVRSNGPMATQPVIRGLTGDRVLVLEDGVRVGDISTTAPDHAVTVEPATLRSVEVIRGPAGLLYGSNTLGGVIHVRREDIPHQRAPGVDWAASTFGESVNHGGSVAGRIGLGAGPLQFHLDGAARGAGDTRTPRGRILPFTDLRAVDAGAGVSVVRDTGHLGGVARLYRSTYGVPSSFQGVTLPGSHDGGVYVEAERLSMRADGEWRMPGSPAGLDAIAFGGNWVRFEQREYEEGGFVGTHFGQLAASGEAVARIRGDAHRGAMGVALHWKDLRAAGSFTGTRPAYTRSLALFAVEEIRIGQIDLLAGIRADWSRISPLDSTETLLVRGVRTREFSAMTGAVGLRVPIFSGWSATVQVAKAFRPPSIEELFSAGPHLASYAYEIGDPDLEPEEGVGVDLLLNRTFSRGSLEIAGFRMETQGFIGFEPVVDSATGIPLRDPRLRRYVVYAPIQRHALISGMEMRARLFPLSGWSAEISADLLQGHMAGGDPLPSIPPGSARAELRRTLGWAEVAADLDFRAPQRRTPPPPRGAEVGCQPEIVNGEATVLPAHFCPTDGTLLLGLLGSFRFGGQRVPWSTHLTVRVDNLMDARWHDPLWRAKQVAPQPGRNLRIGVRVNP